MINDLRTAALRRYHETFYPKQYNAITEQLASNLYAERDDSRLTDGMIALQDACLELCGHPDHEHPEAAPQDVRRDPADKPGADQGTNDRGDRDRDGDRPVERDVLEVAGERRE